MRKVEGAAAAGAKAQTLFFSIFGPAEAVPLLQNTPADRLFQQAVRPCPCYKTPQQIDFFNKLSGRALVTKHPSRSTFSTNCQAVPLLQNSPADRLFQQAVRPCPCYKTPQQIDFF